MLQNMDLLIESELNMGEVGNAKLKNMQTPECNFCSSACARFYEARVLSTPVLRVKTGLLILAPTSNVGIKVEVITIILPTTQHLVTMILAPFKFQV